MSANSDYYWDIVFGGLLANFLLRRSEFISANSDYFWDSVFGGLLAKLPQENFKYQQIQIFWDSVFVVFWQSFRRRRTLNISKFRYFLGQCVWWFFGKVSDAGEHSCQRIQIIFGTVCLVVFWQSFPEKENIHVSKFS